MKVRRRKDESINKTNYGIKDSWEGEPLDPGTILFGPLPQYALLALIGYMIGFLMSKRSKSKP